MSAAAKEPGVGYSLKITDPAFSRYLKKTGRYFTVITLILAVLSIVGFFIYGEIGTGMSNPGSIIIGILLGIFFLAIAFFNFLGRQMSKTWDGTVEDKKIKRRTQDHETGSSYLVYFIYVRSDSGKKHKVKVTGEALYDYYKIGDRVRHHAKLKTLEKYDKRGAEHLPCNACGSFNSIANDYCFQCKCPLLK